MPSSSHAGSAFSIRMMLASDVPNFEAHFARHKIENGQGGDYFMPFSINDAGVERAFDFQRQTLPLSEAGWERYFIALTELGEIVGSLDIQGSNLKAGLHRCLLGMGIEQAYRGAGLGRRLMEAAIAYAKASSELDWIDLRVFSDNAAARKLYVSMGFVEVGNVSDCFRMDGVVIDDVMMTLQLQPL